MVYYGSLQARIRETYAPMKTTSIVILVILTLVLGGFALFSKQSPATPDVQDSGIPDPSPSVGGSDDAEEAQTPDSTDTTNDVGVATVTYTVGGFSPSEVTVNTGDTVRFVNESGAAMWVAGAAHPVHKAYDGTTLSVHCASGAATSFDQCRAGDDYSFTFEKTGTWKYHDHLHASRTGTVIVR